MSVLEQVRADSIRAMKAGDKQLSAALRLLLSELQKDAKDGAGDELAVLRRERKRRLEAATQFRGGGREDLAGGEDFEAAMISRYLPADLDDQKLSEIVQEAISESGATTPKDMGAVMKIVMDRAGGQVDGKRASSAVRAALGA